MRSRLRPQNRKSALASEARELTPEQFRRLMDGFAIEGSIKEIYTKQQDAGDGKVREQDS